MSTFRQITPWDTNGLTSYQNVDLELARRFEDIERNFASMINSGTNQCPVLKIDTVKNFNSGPYSTPLSVQQAIWDSDTHIVRQDSPYTITNESGPIVKLAPGIYIGTVTTGASIFVDTAIAAWAQAQFSGMPTSLLKPAAGATSLEAGTLCQTKPFISTEASPNYVGGASLYIYGCWDLTAACSLNTLPANLVNIQSASVALNLEVVKIG